jgi:repressor LexA
MSKDKISTKQQKILDIIESKVREVGYPPTVREICEIIGLRSSSSVQAHLEALQRLGYIRRDPAKPRAIEIVYREHGGKDIAYTDVVDTDVVQDVHGAMDGGVSYNKNVHGATDGGVSYEQRNREQEAGSQVQATSTSISEQSVGAAIASTVEAIIDRPPTSGRPPAKRHVGKSTLSHSDSRQIPLVGNVAAGTPILAEENIEGYFPLTGEMSDLNADFCLRVKGRSMINAGIFDGDIIFVHSQQTADNGQYVVALIDDSATVKTFYKEKNHIRLQPENDDLEPIITRDASILGKVTGVFRRMR